MEQQRELKIKTLRLKNIKCYQERDIDLSGRSVHLVADNGKGKSTIIQFVKKFMFENGVKVSEAIKQGADTGEAEAVFQDQFGQMFVGKIAYKTNARGEQVETYTMTGPDGGKFDRAAREKLLGERFLFDAVEFATNQASAPGRAKNLEKVFKPLLGVDFEDTDGQIKELSERRRMAGQEKSTIESMFDGNGITLEDVEKDYEMPDTAAIKGRLDAAAQKNRRLAELSQKIDSNNEEIARKKAQVQALMSQVADLEEETRQATEQLATIGTIESVESIQDDYAAAVATENRIKMIKGMKPQVDKLVAATVAYEDLTAKIAGLKKSKIDACEKASGKLPGQFKLSINDKDQIELRYTENGLSLPFDETSIPRSRMIIASVVLGMELLKDSAFRIITIEDASLLGKGAYDTIMSAVNEMGFQALIEEVGPQEEVEIKYVTEITK